MSFRFCFKLGAVATAFGLCVAPGLVCAGESPAGATPKEAVSTPNVNEMELSRPGVSVLEDRIPSRPETFESLFGNRPVVVGPVRVVGPTGSRKGLLDREEEWPFLTPEDAVRDYVMREVLKMREYSADGRELSRVSPEERFYQRLSNRETAKPTTAFEILGLFGPTRDPAAQKEKGPMPGDFNAIAFFSQRPTLPLNEVASTPLYTGPVQPESALDLLPAARKELPQDLIRERKAEEERMNELRKIWGFQNAPDSSLMNLPALSSDQAAAKADARAPEKSAVTDRLTGLLPANRLDPLAVTTPDARRAPAYNPAQLPSTSLLMPTRPTAPLPPGQEDPSTAAPAPAKTKPPAPATFSVPQRRF